MALFLFTNNPITTIAGAINNVATSVTLAPGAGALFPNPGAGQQFAMTLISASNPLIFEIVYCTARSTDVCTIVRGQESTTALSWSAGDTAAGMITAGVLKSMVQVPPVQFVNGASHFAASGMPADGTITLSGAARYTLYMALFGNLQNSNGTAISPVIGFVVKDGVAILATCQVNFQASNLPTGYNTLIQFAGVVNVPAPTITGSYTVHVTDDESDGASHAYTNTMLIANATALFGIGA